MPSSRSARPRPAPTAVPPPPLPAVTLALAVGAGRPAGLAAVLDAERPGAHPLDRVDEAALDAVARRSAGTVVLVSVRPIDGPDPTPADVAAWQRARHRHDAAGVPLADWLLVGRGRARSMAGGRRSPWARAPR